MKKLLVLMLALYPVFNLAHGQPVHAHGAGQLGIVVEGSQLSVLLEIPQYDLVGFERAPRDARERLTVQAAMDKLNAQERLFTPSTSAQCKFIDKKIDAPLLSGGKSPDGHGDMTARYFYRCTKPESLTELGVNVMREFKGVRTLVVSFSGPKGQKAGKVDRKNTVFAW